MKVGAYVILGWVAPVLLHFRLYYYYIIILLLLLLFGKVACLLKYLCVCV
jgi:hypothetical protein